MVTIRNVPCDELAAITPQMDGVMQRAYGAASFAAQIQWYIAVQPDAVVVAEDHGVVVGTGCGIGYEDAGFGWVGVIATEPGFERRGMGRLVTERVIDSLARHGCAPVLDASLSGGPLYERMGFVDHGLTRIVSREPIASAAPVPAITPDDVADVAAFDRHAFGADRTVLIDVLVQSHAGRTMVVRGSGGEIKGFAVAQAGVIGPLAAADGNTLSRLVNAAAALPWTRPPQICVPPESTHLATLQELGWRVTRELRHMLRGIDAVPVRSDLYAGRASLGIG